MPTVPTDPRVHQRFCPAVHQPIILQPLQFPIPKPIHEQPSDDCALVPPSKIIGTTAGVAMIRAAQLQAVRIMNLSVVA